MSFPKLLRYQRHFRNFWRTIEEYLDMPRAERLELDNLCTDVADDAGRLPLSRRVLTLAMGGADGAEDIIAFCRRSPLVHCYEVDGKPYAVVPAIAVLNLSKQLKKGQASQLPAPGPNTHDDPALRRACEIVSLDGPWWSSSTQDDLDDDHNGDETTTKSELGSTKSRVGRAKSELGARKAAENDPKSRESDPNGDESPTKSELDPAFPSDSSRAQARARPDVRASKPNQTKPRDHGDAPSVAHDQQPSPPGSTDARAIESPDEGSPPPAPGSAGGDLGDMGESPMLVRVPYVEPYTDTPPAPPGPTPWQIREAERERARLFKAQIAALEAAEAAARDGAPGAP